MTASMTLDPRIPVLTVDIQPGSGCIELSGPAVAGWDAEEKRIGWTPDRISNADLLLQNTLKKFTEKLTGDGILEWPVAGSALKDLIDGGMDYWGTVLGLKNYLIISRLAKSLARFIPTGATALERAQAAPLIEIKALSSSLLPLDLLPLGLRPQINPAQEKDEVLADAILLPAFSFITRYMPYDGVSAAGISSAATTSPPITGPYPLRVTYFRSKEAELWEDMRSYLSGGKGSEPIPVLPDKNRFTNSRDIALYMLKPWLVGDGVAGNSIPSDIYVHAHGRRGDDFNTRLQIVFKYQINKRAILTSQNVGEAIQIANGTGGHSGGPVVLLNSCHATDQIGAEFVSAAFKLTNAGTKAVIGPRDRVPAPYAVKFAQAYYQAAQNTPDPGRAVLAARLACLTEFGNPLGCLYFAIGDVG
jgi:hypothetical protein